MVYENKIQLFQFIPPQFFNFYTNNAEKIPPADAFIKLKV